MSRLGIHRVVTPIQKIDVFPLHLSPQMALARLTGQNADGNMEVFVANVGVL